MRPVPKPSKLRRGLSALLIVASVVWIVQVVRQTSPDFDSIGWSVTGLQVSLAAALGLASSITKAGVFGVLLRRREPHTPVRRSMGVFLVSQMVRYLPGRVWGLVYSATELSDSVPQRSVWLTNLEFFLISNMNSFGIMAAAVAWWLNAPVVGVGFLVVIWVALSIELRYAWFASQSTRLLTRKRRPPSGDRRPRRVATLFGFLQLDWCFYIAIWLILMPGDPTIQETLLLSSLYAVAWLVGLLAVIVPAGLVVREAAFVWMGAQVGADPGELLILAAGARLFFMGVDVLAFGLGLITVKYTRSESRSKLGPAESLKPLSSQKAYWDALAHLGSRSVLDPFDQKGVKNDYLSLARDETMLAHTAHAGASRILDLGCGVGALTRVLDERGYQVVGADISPEMLRLARSATKAPLVQIPGLELPFRSGSFDSVVTYGVLVYVGRDDELRLLLREVRRVLRPGGTFLAIEQSSATSRVVEEGLKLQRSVGEYVELLESAGLSVVGHEHIRGGHFPLLYAVGAGMVPRSWWPSVRKLDRLYAKSRLSAADYQDTAFECVALSDSMLRDR